MAAERNWYKTAGWAARQESKDIAKVFQQQWKEKGIDRLHQGKGTVGSGTAWC